MARRRFSGLGSLCDTGKVSLEKVRLDRGGYDRQGRYFGQGPPLYRAMGDEASRPSDVRYVRAPTRAAAKEALRKECPNLKFHM